MRVRPGVVAMLLAVYATWGAAADLTGGWSGFPAALRCKGYDPGASVPTRFDAGHDLLITQTGNDIRAQLTGTGISSEVSGLFFGGVIEGSDPARAKGLITKCRLSTNSPYSATSIEILKVKTHPPNSRNVSGTAVVRVIHYFAPEGAPTWRSLAICKGKLERLQTADPSVVACP